MLPYIVIIPYLSLVDKVTHCSLGGLSQTAIYEGSAKRGAGSGPTLRSAHSSLKSLWMHGGREGFIMLAAEMPRPAPRRGSCLDSSCTPEGHLKNVVADISRPCSSSVSQMSLRVWPDRRAASSVGRRERMSAAFFFGGVAVSSSMEER